MFLKFKDIVTGSKKPYGNDAYNGNGMNHKGVHIPDIISYYNLFLSDDEITYTR